MKDPGAQQVGYQSSFNLTLNAYSGSDGSRKGPSTQVSGFQVPKTIQRIGFES